MTKNEIMRACEEHVKEFEKAIDGIGFKAKGIFNSEMLMFVSIARELDIEGIIESGRARGQSTAIMSECFKDQYEIHSIEYDQYTRDSLIALRRLYKYRNLVMHFGNSVTLIPGLISRKCCILIDGPKGDEALELAADSLGNPLVQAVFLHDFHKDTLQRTIMADLFRQTFFSDDEDFVRRFEYLDEVCWREQAKHMRGWAPYKRGKQRMKSYSATLGVVFNGSHAVNEEACRDYFGRPKSRRTPDEILYGKARAALRKAPALALLPLWFALYHLERARLIHDHE